MPSFYHPDRHLFVIYGKQSVCRGILVAALLVESEDNRGSNEWPRILLKMGDDRQDAKVPGNIFGQVRGGVGLNWRRGRLQCRSYPRMYRTSKMIPRFHYTADCQEEPLRRPDDIGRNRDFAALYPSKEQSLLSIKLCS